VLVAGNIKFDNCPVVSREHFLKMRDGDRVLPFGQLPLLEIDGLKLSQSLPCMMYVARKAGLVPTSPEAQVMVEMVSFPALRHAKNNREW
jgi:glutathione S-transferase